MYLYSPFAHYTHNSIEYLIKGELFRSTEFVSLINNFITQCRCNETMGNIAHINWLHLIFTRTNNGYHTREEGLSNHLGEHIDEFIISTAYNRGSKDNIVYATCPHCFLTLPFCLMIAA